MDSERAVAVCGQIGTISRIENDPSFPGRVSDEEFAERAYIQVLRFGALRQPRSSRH